MKNILFLFGDREISLTNQRVLHLVYNLIRECHKEFRFDLVTWDAKTAKLLTKGAYNYKDWPTTRVICNKPTEVALTMRQRDDEIKPFLRSCNDLTVAGTTMKFWKLVGFDDFLWNISVHRYKWHEEKTTYDLMVLFIPSKAESPNNKTDAFYTQYIHYARSKGIPIVGIHFYDEKIPVIYNALLDHIIEKSELCFRDNYSISTVENAYRQAVFSKNRFPHKTLNVCIINHVRNRELVRQLVEIIGKTKLPIHLVFCTLDYAVKDLTEKEIFEKTIFPILSKYFKSLVVVSVLEFPNVVVNCDVVFSTTETSLNSFTASLGIPNYKVNFWNSNFQKDYIEQILLKTYEEKKKTKTFGERLKECLP